MTYIAMTLNALGIGRPKGDERQLEELLDELRQATEPDAGVTTLGASGGAVPLHTGGRATPHLTRRSDGTPSITAWMGTSRPTVV
jgi:hypothetical protein